MLFYDTRDGNTYLWDYQKKYALGTSLCYTKDWWMRHQFPDLPIGEDLQFFNVANRLAPDCVTTVHGQGMMVARVHSGQTSEKKLKDSYYQKICSCELPKEFDAL
jgi:hypothetical protein